VNEARERTASAPREWTTSEASRVSGAPWRDPGSRWRECFFSESLVQRTPGWFADPRVPRLTFSRATGPHSRESLTQGSRARICAGRWPPVRWAILLRVAGLVVHRTTSGFAGPRVTDREHYDPGSIDSHLISSRCQQRVPGPRREGRRPARRNLSAGGHGTSRPSERVRGPGTKSPDE